MNTNFKLIMQNFPNRKALPKIGRMPLEVTSTRYSLVKGERIVRSVLITQLRN